MDRGNCLDLVHFRIEYQKLFRLPRPGAVLFSIHTLITPLREVVAATPERAHLRHALRGLDPVIAAYKGLSGYLPVVIDALEAASG